MSDTVLYDYWRSSASYRVRIVLNLANIPWRSVSVNLLSGEHKDHEHRQRNPQAQVPVLDIDGQRFTQSLAIIDYLDKTRSLGLFPEQAAERAKVSALAQSIAIDLHPVCNLSVVAYATGGEEPARTQWMQQFITPGLQAYESLLSQFKQDPYSIGDQPSIADVCLMPQLYNADRWKADYTDCHRIAAVAEACSQHPAFIAAQPENVKPA